MAPQRNFFLAVPIPRHLRQSVAAKAVDLTAGKVTVVLPERYHLTLIYYGGVGTDSLEQLGSTIDLLCRDRRPFELGMGGAGQFRRGTVLWFGVTGEVERLARTRRQLLDATREFGSATSGSKDPDRSPFAPHVTIARCRTGEHPFPGFEELSPTWSVIDRFVADRLTLFESTRGRYRPVMEFALGGSSDRPY